MSQDGNSASDPQPHERQLNTIEEIDQHLEQNEHNLQTIENFLENKRVELTQLQNYLIKQFQGMQIWKQQKDKIVTLLTNPIRQLLADVKSLMTNLTTDFKAIFLLLTKQMITHFRAKFVEKDRQIQQKNCKIQEQAKIIERMKAGLEKNVNSPLSNTHSNFVGLRQLSREVSRKKTVESNHHDKILSKSSFLDFHVTRIKSKQRQKQKQKQRIDLSRSPKADRSNQKCLRSFKNYCQQENKLAKTPTAKKIMFEVHRNLKEDFENNTKIQIEHKKYVKQKIECLKNKNSGIFNNDYRPMKLEKKF